MAKTRRLKSEVIKSSAAKLLKQLGAYHNDLPVGELRTSIKQLVDSAEELSIRIHEAFPVIEYDEEESTYIQTSADITGRYGSNHEE
jgi:hypothetical protein